jgi:hypothetical protein
MRPVNADTASRLDCYNDYASGLTAPTSGTNKTFAGPLAMSRIKPEAAGRPPKGTAVAITIAFCRVKKPHRTAGRPSGGNQKPQFSGYGLALPAITP